MKKTMGTLVSISAVFIAGSGANCVAAEPEPATAASSAAVPAIQYQSPFKDYRALGEDKRIPWKAANDEVGKIGGWRVYAREAAQSNAPMESMSPGASSKPVTEPTAVVNPASPPAGNPAKEPAEKSVVKPAPMDHSGHAGHGQPK